MAEGTNQPTSSSMGGAGGEPGEKTRQNTSQAGQQQARQKASEAGEQAKRKASEAGEQAKQRAGEMKEEVRDRAVAAADQQRPMVAERTDHFASALRSAGETLRQQDEQRFGEFADEAAEQVERFSERLRREDVPGMVSDLENAGRRNPGKFLGGTFAAGMMLGRFLRSSTPDDQQRSTGREHDRMTQGRHPAGASDPRAGREQTAGMRVRSDEGASVVGEPAEDTRAPGIRAGGSAMAAAEAGGGVRDAGEGGRSRRAGQDRGEDRLGSSRGRSGGARSEPLTEPESEPIDEGGR